MDVKIAPSTKIAEASSTGGNGDSASGPGYFWKGKALSITLDSHRLVHNGIRRTLNGNLFYCRRNWK